MFAGLESSARAPHEAILHRAYAIWEREGRPENRTLAHWLEAEAEIMGDRTRPQIAPTSGTRPPAAHM